MDISCQNAPETSKQLKQRSVSLDDDDNDSSYSRSSTNLLQSAVSDSESTSPISVRDMVKRYNSAARMDSTQPKVRNPSMTSSKSVYSDVNQLVTSPNVKQFVTQLQEGSPESQFTSAKRELLSSRIRSRLNENISLADNADGLKMGSSKDNKDIVNGFKETSPKFKTLQRVASVEENSNVPSESSYQSKTTIAKTSSGVRIIIDIFFDQEQHKVTAADVVGSRVETDIPQSRILTEFQQQVHQATQPLSSTSN